MLCLPVTLSQEPTVQMIIQGAGSRKLTDIVLPLLGWLDGGSMNRMGLNDVLRLSRANPRCTSSRHLAGRGSTAGLVSLRHWIETIQPSFRSSSPSSRMRLQLYQHEYHHHPHRNRRRRGPFHQTMCGILPADPGEYSNQLLATFRRPDPELIVVIVLSGDPRAERVSHSALSTDTSWQSGACQRHLESSVDIRLAHKAIL
jgi:hypothetical protein